MFLSSISGEQGSHTRKRISLHSHQLNQINVMYNIHQLKLMVRSSADRSSAKSYLQPTGYSQIMMKSFRWSQVKPRTCMIRGESRSSPDTQIEPFQQWGSGEVKVIAGNSRELEEKVFAHPTPSVCLTEAKKPQTCRDRFDGFPGIPILVLLHDFYQ
ncbi:hypothetical protein BGX38DRAFT_1214535 [Terfezia claveryi]|nr:hypothetical protein BGX38DRAFT_1214535 [Terfezia claveryi]